MSLNATTPSEDRIIEKCEEFGGLAAECAEIAQRLDDKITYLINQIGKLEDTINELEEKIEDERSKS